MAIIILILGIIVRLPEEEISCPEQETQILEAEVITEIIVEEVEVEKIVYQDVYKDKIVKEIVYVPVETEVIVPATCPACICIQEYKDCPEESKTFLESKGFTEDKLNREIISETQKQDPAGKEYLSYLILMRNEYEELKDNCN